MDNAPSPQTDAAAGPATIAVAPVPKAVLAQERQADAHHPADGSRRVRGRGAGHGARPPRRLDPAGAAPRRLRRLARRQQGEQHRPRRAHLRPRRAGAFARSPRRCTNCRCPASSTGTSIISWCWKASTAATSTSTIPRSAAGEPTWSNSISPSPASSLAMEPTAAFQRSRQQAAGPAAAAARIALLEDRRRPAGGRQPRAGRARDRRRRLFQDLHRRHSDPAHRQLAHSAADRHGPDRAGARAF